MIENTRGAIRSRISKKDVQYNIQKKTIVSGMVSSAQWSVLCLGTHMVIRLIYYWQLYLPIRVITKLPNSEQSYNGKVKTHNYINRQISQQLENCENRNDPDLVQAFLKKWWVESDFKAPNSRSHYGSKVPAVTVTVFKYRNKIGKIVVKAVPYSVT